MQNDTGGLAPVSYRSQILLEIDFAPWKLEIDSLPIFSKAVQLNYCESCKARCQGVIQKLKRSGYLGNDFDSFTTLCEAADAAMFSAILYNRNRVLQQLLLPVKNCNYNLRPRAHTRELPPANTKTVKRNFIYRMLYLKHVLTIIHNR